ncbi:uncharacterized protein LOC111274876 isoform X13 [Durio zibethinus]|uniref:Uncharacterized protein LOC111274876 isoform X13 n=2 Tax=Durio zibethinus TaxID=66656 RepID=A0A6P5WHK6_DURZI|nr:uncharacterized protein LOC111274876 isoform X13 [Durio zibethinus]
MWVLLALMELLLFLLLLSTDSLKEFTARMDPPKSVSFTDWVYQCWLLRLFCLDSRCCMPRMAMLVILLWLCSHGLPQNSFLCNISSTFVILVTVLVFLFMMTFSVLIWIRMEDNPIDSSTVARVYVDLFAVAILLLGGALACYGLLLCQKMRNVRSERASSEIWKVAGLAIVSVLCFTSSAFVALFTDIPVLYHWHELHINGVYTSLLLILYYFIGSSVPSAFVLWVMRELPPMSIANIPGESTTITFITDSSAEVHHPQGWTTAASSQNQVHISFCLYIRFIQNLLIHVYFCSLCQPDLSNFTCFYMRYMVFLSLPTCIGNVVASYYLHIRYTSESCSDLVRDWLVQILPKRQFHSLIIEN